MLDLLIHKVTYQEINDYMSKKSTQEENEFDIRYYNRSGHNYSAYTVLNYIVGRYDNAISNSQPSFSIMTARLNEDACTRISNILLPFLKEVKGVDLRMSTYDPYQIDIILVTPDALNVIEWPLLSGASPVKKPLLLLKE